MSGDVVQPRLGLVGWLRWAWRQLTSMRTALLLLLVLAVGAVPLVVPSARTILGGAQGRDLIPALGATGLFEVVYAVLIAIGVIVAGALA